MFFDKLVPFTYEPDLKDKIDGQIEVMPLKVYHSFFNNRFFNQLEFLSAKYKDVDW